MTSDTGEQVHRETSDALQSALARLRSIDGLVSAGLVEPDSAHVLEMVDAATTPGSAPGPRPESQIVAAGACDLVQVVALMSAGLGENDDLEEVVVTLGRHHHVVTPLPSAGVNGLLLVVRLDRARTNLARARQQLRAAIPLLQQASGPGGDGVT